MPEVSPIIAAVACIQALLLGSVATTAGVLAVAACGLGMLRGRSNRRAGLRVALGVGIVFGATRIAYGMLAAAQAQADAVAPLRAAAQLPGEESGHGLAESPRLALDAPGRSPSQ